AIGGPSGIHGISFTGRGSLHVQEVLIRGFVQNGINFAPSAGVANLNVSDETVITNNNNGTATLAGILVRPTGAAGANVSINGVQLEKNANGVSADAGGTTGGINVTVRDSKVTASSNAGIAASSPSPAM